LASTSDIAKRYFAALGARNLPEAIACWKPGAIDRLVGAQDLAAPDGIRQYFSELFSAFPDFDLEVLELTTARSRTAVRWRATGTFAGPGTFQGFAPQPRALEPGVAWAGHADPVTGDARGHLERAAEAAA
jgi:predicted ester cyclase